MVEIVRLVKFGYEPNVQTERLLHDYRDTPNFCLKRAFETNSFSIKKLHHACYSMLRRRGSKPVARKLFINFSPTTNTFRGR